MSDYEPLSQKDPEVPTTSTPVEPDTEGGETNGVEPEPSEPEAPPERVGEEDVESTERPSVEDGVGTGFNAGFGESSSDKADGDPRDTTDLNFP